MEKDLISVIIPVYNRAETIARTIDNMLLQSYRNIEIIIVDDGSTDDIEVVMEKYKANEKISFFRNLENRGACFARNYGIDKSNGEYIAFQDSDDLWNNYKLEKQLKELKESKADICICGMITCYENGKKITYHKKSFGNNDITLENELGKSFISTQLILGKRECFNKERFDEKFPRFQDWDIGIRLVKKFKIVYLNEILVKREMQSNSISKNMENGYIGVSLLLKKYENEYRQYPKAEAKILEFFAQYQEYKNEDCTVNLLKSLKLDFRFKTFLKYVFKVTGIYKFIQMKKHGRK